MRKRIFVLVFLVLMGAVGFAVAAPVLSSVGSTLAGY